MKGLIILAITIFLVGVQASPSSTVQMELGDVDDSKSAELLWMLAESGVGTEVKDGAADDTSTTLGALDKFQKMEAIEDVLRFLQNYKDVIECTGNTCKFCALSACIKITFIKETKEFNVCLTFKDKEYYCKTIPAKEFKYCMKVLLIVNICVEIKNVKISEGKVCMDVGVCVSGICKNFPTKCFGTSNYLKTT